MNNFNIICFNGGVGGALVNAVIDDTDTKIVNSIIEMKKDRVRLKNFQALKTDQEKLEYLNFAKIKYKSIPSHDLEFHIRYQHDYIAIGTLDHKTAIKASERFKNVHGPHVWEGLQKFCKINTVEDYAMVILTSTELMFKHTPKIILVEDILAGNLLNQLSKYVKTPLNEIVYREWLSKQNR